MNSRLPMIIYKSMIHTWIYLTMVGSTFQTSGLPLGAGRHPRQRQVGREGSSHLAELKDWIWPPRVGPVGFTLQPVFMQFLMNRRKEERRDSRKEERGHLQQQTYKPADFASFKYQILCSCWPRLRLSFPGLHTFLILELQSSIRASANHWPGRFVQILEIRKGEH